MMEPMQQQRVGRMTRVAMIVSTTLLAGTLMGMPGIGCAGRVANNFNPCGTILDCDPLEYDLFTHRFPDWSLDPTCTIPGMCGGVFPFGGVGTVDPPEGGVDQQPAGGVAQPGFGF